MCQRRTLALLLALLFLLWPVTGLAATYQVTEEELTRLETVFHELRTANAILMGDSTKSQQDLIRALKLLRESQEELKTLQALLTTLQAESKLAKSDLSQANAELAKAKKSFEQYAKEQRQLKTERILWGLAGIGIGLLMPK